MKTASTAVKMRWIAGVLYGIFFVFQLLTVNLFFQVMMLFDMPFSLLAQLGTGLLAAGVCVWLFSGKAEVKEGARRAFVAATVLAVVMELALYSSQMNWFSQIINYNLMQGVAPTFPFNLLNVATQNVGIVYMVMVIIRLMLLILAAFFITSARDGIDEDEEAEDMFGEDEAVAVEVVEQVVVLEVDEEADEETDDAPAEQAEEAAEEAGEEEAVEEQPADQPAADEVDEAEKE